MQKILRIDPKDNLIVALRDLAQGDIIENDGQRIQLVTDVPAKHKFTREPVPVGGIVTLYGVPVGKAVAPLQSGERITVDNVVHYAAEVDLSDAVPYMWKAPDVSRWANRTFDGVIRPDGRVGTANYWLIIPLVFCENRNALKLRDALERTLGTIWRTSRGRWWAARAARPRPGLSRISTASGPSPITAGAAARLRMRGPYAGCWPPTRTIPTWRGSPCSALAARRRRSGCFRRRCGSGTLVSTSPASCCGNRTGPAKSR